VALPTPVTPAGVRGLAALLAAPAHALLAFDFDGVLAPIVADPEQAYAEPRSIQALADLAPRVGALAVITGRPAAIAARLGGFADRPELADLVIFGQYGRERWDAHTGRVLSPPPPPAIDAARLQLPPLLADTPGGVDAFIEDKGSALAVHTRRAPMPAQLWERLHRPMADLASRLGLHLEPGRLVLELRAPGMDKGEALRAYAQLRSATVVGYIGDDLGDLPAFAAIDNFAQLGLPGLKICSGSTEVTELAQRADLVVDGPAGVADLLEELLRAL
jgi:trehalose 6-phosphate phosphatase